MHKMGYGPVATRPMMSARKQARARMVADMPVDRLSANARNQTKPYGVVKKQSSEGSCKCLSSHRHARSGEIESAMIIGCPLESVADRP